MTSCGRYSPKYVSSCSTPSTIESSTSPVRSSPKWAGPSATTFAQSRLRSTSCTRAAVRWAIMARACSMKPRSTITTATSAKGRARSEKASPANTRASSQPSSASRPIPIRDENTPIAAVAAIRRRIPRVNGQSLGSRNMETMLGGIHSGESGPFGRVLPRAAPGDAGDAAGRLREPADDPFSGGRGERKPVMNRR